MKAALCKSFDGPQSLIVEDIPEPMPGPGQIRIKVEAAALNFFDTLIIRNKYQYKPELPFSPAAEMAGTVDVLGEGATGFTKGQRVLAYSGWGGAREKAVVKAEMAIPVPEGVAPEIAAGLTVTYGTAMHGLRDRGSLREGETLAVLGAAGGAGLAAVEIGARIGARVIAVASSADKLAICKQHGASEVINYAEQDLKEALKALTGGKGADVVYDCVGAEHTEPAVRALAWEGRLLVVGFAGGDIPKIPINLLLLKGCSLVGVFWGEFNRRDPSAHRANIEQVLSWVASGALSPRVHSTYPLARIADALTAIERREATGKVIVVP